MTDCNVIACFMIERGTKIVCQSSFQVSSERGTLERVSRDGGVFHFCHYYAGTLCTIVVSWRKAGKAVASKDLVVPINRTKIKWKETMLGEEYRLFYRCVFEIWDGPRAPKAMRKQQRRAAIARAARGPVEPQINLLYVGGEGEDS